MVHLAAESRESLEVWCDLNKSGAREPDVEWNFLLSLGRSTRENLVRVEGDASK
jgi:hypothetical protein